MAAKPWSVEDLASQLASHLLVLLKRCGRLTLCPALAVCLVLLVVSTAALADTTTALGEGKTAVVYLVLGTDAWSHGQVLDLPARIELTAGVELGLLLDIGGQPRRLRLRGPYEGTVAASKGTMDHRDEVVQAEPARDGWLSYLAELLKPVPPPRVRDELPPTLEAADPWNLDISLPGDWCVRPAEVPTLWRGEVPARQRVYLLTGPDADTQQRHTLRWPAEASTLPWPEDVPLRDGDKIRFDWSGTTVEQRIHMVPGTLLETETAPLHRTLDTAAWMLSTGCNTQAIEMLDSLPEVSREGWLGGSLPEVPESP